MDNVIGIIFSSCRPDLLKVLTKKRPIAAVPFGGRYQLLDFALSNMVNSGLRTVGIIIPHHYRPMLNHLGSGNKWLLNRKKGGLFILPGVNYGVETGSTKFFLKDLILNTDFLKKESAKYVIISYCGLVININYKEALRFHEKKEADITLIYKEEEVDPEEKEGLLIEIKADGKVEALSSRLSGEGSRKRKRFLDSIIIQRELLLQLLQEPDVDERTDFLKVVAQNVKELQVYAFQFKGYLGRIDSVRSYFDCSMDLLKPRTRRDLFMGPNKIHTKIADNPPSRYGSQAVVRNSLVSSGCKIEGQVENSILFREVYIKPGAIIKNSIIMQKNYIGKGVTLENVISDKYVRFKDQTKIKGAENLPIIIEETAVVGVQGGVFQ